MDLATSNATPSPKLLKNQTFSTLAGSKIVIPLVWHKTRDGVPAMPTGNPR